MTKLTEEIEQAIFDNINRSDDKHAAAKAAAEVAKRYIEKAWNNRLEIYFEGKGDFKSYHKTEEGRLQQWLKENGITE